HADPAHQREGLPAAGVRGRAQQLHRAGEQRHPAAAADEQGGQPGDDPGRVDDRGRGAEPVRGRPDGQRDPDPRRAAAGRRAVPEHAGHDPHVDAVRVHPAGHPAGRRVRGPAVPVRAGRPAGRDAGRRAGQRADARPM
ncbi:MAG: hypothetical protein AVDCRST_MAG64-2637, partial [uncultured Phycisphaerae bacterium]